MSLYQSSLIGLAALLGLCGAAQAQHHSVYVGGGYFDINSKSDPLVGGAATPTPVNLRVGDSSTLGFGYVYQVSDAWAVELALGLPPRHKVYGEGFIAPFGQVSSVKQVCPTVFVNYHFGEIAPRLRPVAGVGLNYTHFKDMRSTPSGDAASGGPTTIDLSDSWGLAVHGGLSYQLSERLSLTGMVAYADVQSDLTATTRTSSGNVVRTTRIDFRPVVYTLSLGYHF